MTRIGSGIAASLAAVLWTAMAHASCISGCNVTLTYPGTAPCDTTLQACIDSAAAGDTVQIATNGPIAESLLIQQSLTLIAAPGFTPLFSGTQSITVDTPSTGGHAIHIEGLTFQQGNIQVSQSSTGVLSVQILGNTFEQSPASLSTPGIDLISGAGVLGQVTFDLSRNAITIPAGQYGSGIVVDLGADTSMSGTIANNSIVMDGTSTNGGAILLGFGQCVASASVDVIANRILANAYAPAGISVTQMAGCPGPITMRVLDNQVTSALAVNQAQPLDAIVFSVASGAFSGTVVNNTVVGFRNGIAFPQYSQAATVSGLAANNVVSTCNLGLYIDPAVAVTNRNNLLFDDPTEQFTPGPNTLDSDPLFVDAASDYRLQRSSPAIDAGDTASVPVDLPTDLAGNPRIVGASVDIGAYEAPEPEAAVGGVAAAAALMAVCRLRPFRANRDRVA